MTAINLDSVISARDDIMTSEQFGEMVMMNIDRGYYYGLQEVATVIWKEIEQPTRVADLITALLARFDVDRETCEEQTLAYLDDLKTEELIIVHAPTPA